MEMSSPQSNLRATEESQSQLLAPDPSATFTGDPSAKARLAWGQFLAFRLDEDYEQRVFSAPGVVQALDEAIAELHAAEDAQ
jgi:hypothetical protein